MLQRLREWLTLFLVAVLPLHALLVTFGTKLIEGPGNAPMTALAFWKEGVLGIILILAALEFVLGLKEGQPSLRLRLTSRKQKAEGRVDVFDVLIVCLIILSVIVTALTHGDWKLYLFGFKYDFIPLVAFMVLRRVEWSEEFQKRVLGVILVMGGIVATYGIISFFLPQSFFVWLGYSDLHSLYRPDAPLAAFQQIGDLDIRRVQSTMSGPNQLGLWLLVPWSVGLLTILRSNQPIANRQSPIIFAIGIAILLTFSRSAWIAAFVITVVALKMQMPKDVFKRYMVRGAGLIMLLAIFSFMFAPGVIFRLASSRDHILRPMTAVVSMVRFPFGRGLGTAGPASNRVSDACVHLAEGADASWAADRPDLCVFVGNEQVQPADPCACPNLPENWYLQIGVELGIIGFVLFAALIVLLLRKLIVNYQLSIINSSMALSFLGISIAALFLHAWEDAAVAYTVWILIAAQLSSFKASSH